MYSAFKWTEAAMFRNELTRRYEPLQPFVLLELAREAHSEIFIDIGANIGVYSIFFCDLPSISKVVAFEASPDTFRELSKNVLQNNLDGKIELQNLAVSNNNEPLKFGIINNLSGANSVIETSIHNTEKFTDVITVQSTRIDDLLGLRDQRICIKIDVEGHEASVIAGAMSILMHNRCVLQMENYGDDNEIVDKLIGQGFRTCFSVGPDVYLTNDPSIGKPEQMLRVFEAASKVLIASNLNPPKMFSKRRRGWRSVIFKVRDRLTHFLRAMTKRSA